MFNLKKKYIASGNYFVSGSSPVILRAIVGTCVGVAIYDADKGIGGLIHILLPEPTSKYPPYNPVQYASSGLPLFIQALCDAGAEKQNMKAIIAGGALVGPISNHDLYLDIGGRCADIVKEILAEHLITIERSETGGFLSWSLNLDMLHFTVSIEPSALEKISIKNDGPAFSIKKIHQTIDNLSPIPQAAIKILKMMDDDSYDNALIAKEVKKDQVLSARTLKLCNSAIFGLRRQVNSLEDSLMLLGKDLFIKMVISSTLKNYFNPNVSGYSLCKGGLYYHAVGTALIAEKLANETGKEQPSIAYVAGLIHDIGKIVLDQYVSSTYPLFYRELQNKEVNMTDIEKAIMGIDHIEVGCLLARRWGLTDCLIEAIRCHHFPDNATSNLNIADIVHAADLLMYRFHSDLEVENLSMNNFYSSISRLGLSVARTPEIIDSISGHFSHITVHRDMDTNQIF